MTLTILTPNGTAQIKDCTSKQGKQALIKYIDRLRIERNPFIVLPPKACATDLHDVTSVDYNDYD
jgi:hypothetical protein